MVEWMVGHLAASRVDWMVDWTVYSMDAWTVVHLAEMFARAGDLFVESMVDSSAGHMVAQKLAHQNVGKRVGCLVLNLADRLTATMAVLTVEQKVDRTVGQRAAMMVAMMLETLVEELAE